MHWSIVFTLIVLLVGACGVLARLHVTVIARNGIAHLGGVTGLGRQFVGERGLIEHDGLLVVLGHISGQGLRERVLLLARSGDACLLVFVVRIARRAARLFHLVVDHRDDRVVGDAALTRTVVVQNVTEPKPALLH
jgi:hypothetical protein